MIRALLLWLTARLPVKVIGRPKTYVEWYHLFTIPGVCRVQLHRFVRSDPDGLHDHPWGWAFSLILANSYLEQRRDRDRIRRFGYFIGGDTFHRVVLRDERDVWTLFVHGPYVKHWGFFSPISMVDDETRPGYIRAPSWRDRVGALWRYSARDRDADGFSDWPWAVGTPRGRDIRRAA